MKRLFVAALVPSMLGLATAGVLAQQRPATPPAERPAPDRPAERPDAGPAFTMPAGAYDSDRVVGAKVKDAQGKDIGSIDSLVIDPQEGRITHVVIGRGGVLGIGERKVVVPWEEVTLTPDKDGDRLVVAMDESTLDAAPRYERRAARERAPAASPATPGTPAAPADRR